MTDAPDISVLMAVYNGAECAQEAIDSILNQSFKNFEFIIVDDGSSDDTPRILTEYAQKDSRIKLVTQQNTGLTQALNNGLKLCQSALIARQDADDVSYPSRLQKQYDFMISTNNADVVLLGGVCDDEHLDGIRSVWSYKNNEEINNTVYLKSPFAHSTVMFRREAAEKLNGYDVRYKTSQDMEFWMRLHAIGKVEMLETPILLRRVNERSITVKRKWRQFYDSSRARLTHAPWFKTKLKALGYSLIIGLLSALPLSFKNQLIRAVKQKSL